MVLGNLLKKKLSEASGDGKKISEITGAETFGDFVKMVSGQKPIGGTISKSTPTSVDVSAEGMKKKKLKGTGVTYSGVKTSSQGLLTGARTEKKTLLGG